MSQPDSDRHPQRPVGVSSCLRPAPGPRRTWISGGVEVPLPVVLDIVNTDPAGEELWRAEGTVDLVGGEPQLVAVQVRCATGMDPGYMQVEFRWATPLEVVTRIVPRIIAAGGDPFQGFFPASGFPAASREGDLVGRRLSDEFLEDIAKDYLTLGRGYSRELARQHSVSERTVISWVQKARSRGILTAAPSGRVGGEIVPATRRV